MNYNIILASKSPRRQELLQHIVPHFEVRTKEIEEIYPSTLAAKDVAAYLAELKANAFENDLKENELLITSDTTVCLENKLYGKPKDDKDAFQILKELSGKKHQVITGVCLLSNNKKEIFSETTHVYFKELSNEEIQFYIENYKPFDKAGAYAIQEWIGMIGIEKIEGDYFNVVGLPLFSLNKRLRVF